MHTAIYIEYNLTKKEQIRLPLPVKGTSQLGLERFEQVRTRVNQGYFRSILLSNYTGICCLTGIDIPALLTASHIKPWSAATPSERPMSSNGLLLNALHDRAFDRSLITLDDRYCVVASSHAPHTPANDQWLYAFDRRKIALLGDDESTWPSLDFIHYHNDCVFERRAKQPLCSLPTPTAPTTHYDSPCV